MKKQITKGNTTYTIKVTLNYKVEKRINGRRHHLVEISNNINKDTEEIYLENLLELNTLENNLQDLTVVTTSSDEIMLTEMGYSAE